MNLNFFARPARFGPLGRRLARLLGRCPHPRALSGRPPAGARSPTRSEGMGSADAQEESDQPGYPHASSTAGVGDSYTQDD
jgi:hypothetical protein